MKSKSEKIGKELFLGWPQFFSFWFTVMNGTNDRYIFIVKSIIGLFDKG